MTTTQQFIHDLSDTEKGYNYIVKEVQRLYAIYPTITDNIARGKIRKYHKCWLIMLDAMKLEDPFK